MARRPPRPRQHIHKLLIWRIGAAAISLAVILSGIVLYQQRDRVRERILADVQEATRYFNFYVLDVIARADTVDDRDIQAALERFGGAGRASALGQYVYIEIRDLNNKLIAKVAGETPATVSQARQFLERSSVSPPRSRDAHYASIVDLGDGPYVELVIPLVDNANDLVAYSHGLFEVSPDTRAAVWRRIYFNVAVVIGIVLLTAIALYPVILRLIKRIVRVSDDLLESNLSAIELLGAAVAKRDSDTDVHNYRVTIYSVKLAEHLGLDPVTIRSLIKGAFLHDVGKIGISDNILLKPGRLTEAEFVEMRKHVAHGVDIVKRAGWLEDAADVVGYHHEKFDGSGYDRGLVGESIPVTARIFSIADVFDALTSQRPYKKAFTYEQSIQVLEESSGSHFDPEFIAAFKTIARPLYDAYADRDDNVPRQALNDIVQRYFHNEVVDLVD